MPGQAIISINENQWSVSLATTYTELTTGLSGVASIPAGTGMLFILPEKRQVTVDTSAMLFNIDIVFISDNTVIDVATNIQPGYLVTEETPCDMFLEVNAGEAAGVEVGDTVTTEIIQPIQQPGVDFGQIISFAIPVAVLGFVCTMAGGVMKLVGGSSGGKCPSLSGHSSPSTRELPQVKKSTVKCPVCEKVIEIPEYDRVTRSEALRRHIEAEHSHHSEMGKVRFIGACKVVDGLCHTHGYPVSKTVRCPQSELTDEEWVAAWELVQEAFPEGQHNPWVNGWWPETLEEAEMVAKAYERKMGEAVGRFRARQQKAVENYERAAGKAAYNYRRYVLGEYERGRGLSVVAS